MQRNTQPSYESESSTDSESQASYEEPLYRMPTSHTKNGPSSENIKSKGEKIKPVEPVYPKPTEEELDEFKGQLDEWVRLEDQIRKLNIAKRERLLRLKALGNTVQQFMKTFGYEHINRKDGSHIKYNERVVKQPVKMNDIKTKLLTLNVSQFTPEKLLEELFKDDSRERVVKTKLSRVIPKVSGTLDL